MTGQFRVKIDDRSERSLRQPLEEHQLAHVNCSSNLNITVICSQLTCKDATASITYLTQTTITYLKVILLFSDVHLLVAPVDL